MLLLDGSLSVLVAWLESLRVACGWRGSKELVWLSHLTIGIWTIFVKSVSTSLISHLRQRFLGDILNGLQCGLAFVD